MSKNAKMNDKKYVRSFIAFSNQIESWIVRTVVGLLILLLISQFLLQFHPIRSFLSLTDQLEGRPFDTDK